MSSPKRKIAFYSITLKDKSNNNIKLTSLFNSIKNTLNLQKTDPARQLDVKSSSKFNFLDIVDIVSKDTLFLIFKTAKYNHCPPLLDTNTLNERSNNKTPDEGESEKTHAAMKFDDEEAIMILEERSSGISFGSIKTIFEQLMNKAYQSNLIKQLFTIESAIIPGNDFAEELKKLKTVKIGELYMSKQILGSDQLNFSNNFKNVNEDLIMTVKAKRNLNIRDTIDDLVNFFLSSKSIIRKMRIRGIGENNTKVVIDTSFFKKAVSIDVDLDSLTQIVDSNLMKNKMISILNDFVSDEGKDYGKMD